MPLAASLAALLALLALCAAPAAGQGTTGKAILGYTFGSDVQGEGAALRQQLRRWRHHLLTLDGPPPRCPRCSASPTCRLP